jgi:hypothetical protein
MYMLVPPKEHCPARKISLFDFNKTARGFTALTSQMTVGGVSRHGEGRASAGVGEGNEGGKRRAKGEN